ncbi:MAG: hypothetical protein O6826_09495 [Acidobacteria bacterium]|nr:hypothetical protein [Acidobacteriota bacterium]
MEARHVIRLHGERYLRRLPSIVAYEEGIFPSQGLDVVWIEPDPVRQAFESVDIQHRIKESLLEQQELDIYKVCQWGGIKRSIEGHQAGIFAVGKPDGSNTHAVFARAGSDLQGWEDLADRPIGINAHAGSFYGVREILQRHLPSERIQTVHVGTPLRRLRALLAGEIEVAELMDLLIPLAEIKGLVRVLEEADPRPGVFVANRNTPVPALQAFIRAWNQAVDIINHQPEKYQQKAIRKFLEKLPPELQVPEQDLIDKIQFPRFAHIRRYSREEFWDTYSWMVSNDLIQAGSEYEDAVIAGLTADT